MTIREHAVKKAFLEDLAPGQVFTSDARAVLDAGAIKRFAGEFDPQPFHLDEGVQGHVAQYRLSRYHLLVYEFPHAGEDPGEFGRA